MQEHTGSQGNITVQSLNNIKLWLANGPTGGQAEANQSERRKKAREPATVQRRAREELTRETKGSKINRKISLKAAAITEGRDGDLSTDRRTNHGRDAVEVHYK